MAYLSPSFFFFNKKIDLVVKNCPTVKIPGPNNFIRVVYKTFKEEVTPISHNSFRKLKRKKFFPTHSMKPHYSKPDGIVQEKKGID